MEKFDEIIHQQQPGLKTAKDFSVMPIEILSDKSLKLTEKFVMSEIVTMTVYAGEFHASNEYLAGLMGLKKNSISRVISDLHNRGYIERLGYYCPKSKKTWKRVLKPLVFTDCRIFALKSDEISSHLFRDKTILDSE